MSYSINVREPTKAKAKKAVAEKLDGVVEQQKVHKSDRALAERAASAALDVLGKLPDGETHDYSVTVSGYIATTGTEVHEGGEVTGVNVSIVASILEKPTG